MTRIPLLAALALLGACTTLKIGHGDTNTISHEGGAESGKELAERACQKAGGQHAEVISTVNKDASLPPGTGKQQTTFRSVSR